MKEVKKEQKEMKKTQENILKELRINNLKLAKVTENLTESMSENKEEHKEFYSRIETLEKKAV